MCLNNKRNNQRERLENKLGQYLIVNPKIVQAIVEKTDIKRTDVVLEIGSGTGNLTIELLKRAKRVISIEFDPKMVLELQRNLRGISNVTNLTLISGDILKINLPDFDVCVANIPYQLSAPLTLKLLAHKPIFRSAVIMYQTEFAMRLMAKPGEPNYGRMSVNTNLMSNVKYLLKVGAINFRPRPKVESTVLKLEPRNPKPLVEFLEWDGLIRICFERKNKTLGSIFRHSVNLSYLEQNYIINKEILLRNHKRKIIKISDNNTLTTSKLPISKTMKKKKGSLEFKEFVCSVLVNSDFEDRRSAKMSQEDFLRLLVEMNTKGIYFSK